MTTKTQAAATASRVFIKLGNRGNDTLTGGDHTDLLIGLGGDDLLTGGHGNDLLYGGSGFDTARYSGAFRDYHITNYGGLYSVTDSRTGSPDGSDLLLSVEALKFSDRLIYIDGRNNAPIAAADKAVTMEDVRLRLASSTLLANDRDFEGQALTLSAVGAATHGTVSLAGGFVAYTPAADYYGPASFTYTVRDARGAASTGTVNVTVTPVNDAPHFGVGGAGMLDGTSAYTPGGPPVVLDSDVRVHDVELAARGNYGGASLTLVRHGGADAHDVFSAAGMLGPLTAGGVLVYGGTAVGSVVENGGGRLVLAFGAGATEARVDGVMHSIAYSNADPAASIHIDWTFADGNTGAQGAGGTLAATGSTAVVRALEPDTNWLRDVLAPTGPVSTSGNVLRALAHPGAPDGSFGDHADAALDATRAAVTSPGTLAGAYGTLVLQTDGSYDYTLDGRPDAVKALAASGRLVDNFGYTASDGATTLASKLAISVFGINDAPTAQPDTNAIVGGGLATGNVLQDIFHPGPFGSYGEDHADTDPDGPLPLRVTELFGVPFSGEVTFGNLDGELTLHSDGAYSFLSSGDLAPYLYPFIFVYTVSDGEKSAQSSCAIDIWPLV